MISEKSLSLNALEPICFSVADNNHRRRVTGSMQKGILIVTESRYALGVNEDVLHFHRVDLLVSDSFQRIV